MLPTLANLARPPSVSKQRTKWNFLIIAFALMGIDYDVSMCQRTWPFFGDGAFEAEGKGNGVRPH